MGGGGVSACGGGRSAAAGDAGLRDACGAGAGGAGWRLESAGWVGVGVRAEVDGAALSPVGAAPAAPGGGGPQRDLRGGAMAAGGLPPAEGLGGGGLGFFIAWAVFGWLAGGTVPTHIVRTRVQLLAATVPHLTKHY